MKIEVLFPEICNLYGDLQNINYLKRSCPGLEIVETKLDSRPAFLDEDIALVYMGSMTKLGIKLSYKTLSPFVENIRDSINNGQRMLLTGNALDVFGAYMDSDAGERLPGLGILPCYAEYHMMNRHNSFYLGTFRDMEIVGFKSLFGHAYGAPEVFGWFDTVRGVGRNESCAIEGFYRNNFMATYLIGPLLILNPPLCKWLLREMGLDDKLAFEDAAMENYKKRVAEFHEPERDWQYH